MIIKNTAYGRFVLTTEALSLHMADAPDSYMWEEHLKPWFDIYAAGKVVVECGASAGWHTVYLSRLAKKVIAFEPQAPLAADLRYNLSLNEVTNVEVRPEALYRTSCRMRVRESIDYTQTGHTATSRSLAPDPAGTIEAITVDSLELEELGLLKIDAQGCDLQILLGAEDTIRRLRPALIFEIEPGLCVHYGQTWADYEVFLKSVGYRHVRATEGDRDFLGVPE